MGNPIKGSNIFGPITPLNTSDIYPSHLAKWGQGGLRTVKDLNERNQIPLERRENLMIVSVEDNSFNNSTAGSIFYLLDIHDNNSTSTSLLDNNNWHVLDFGHGGGGWVLPPPPQSVFTGKTGEKSFDNGFIYICVQDNLWKRVAIDWFVNNGTSGFSSTSGGLIFGDVPFWDGSEFSYEKMVHNIIPDVQDGTYGETIIYSDNSTKFIPFSTGGLVIETLDNLKDVIITSPVIGESLIFDGSNWINGSPSTSGLAIDKLIDLNDVNITNVTNGDFLYYDNGFWKNHHSNIYKSLNTVSVSSTGGLISYDNLFSTSGINIGSTIISSNNLKVGDILNVKMLGYLNITHFSNILIRTSLGGITLADTDIFIISSPKTNRYFELEFFLTVRTIGISANVIGQGKIEFLSDGYASYINSSQFVMTLSATINTTINNEFKIMLYSNNLNGNFNITNSFIKKL